MIDSGKPFRDRIMSDLVQRLRMDAWHPDDTRTMAAEEIMRLRAIEAAAQNLLNVRGRHHTAEAYKRLEKAMEK